MAQWNPWHGCHKISSGCKNCYVYRIDSGFDKDAAVVATTANFNLPVKRKRDGSYKIQAGQTVFTCFSSDFFLDEADEWRKEAWQMIRQRGDLDFFIITKRIDRFTVNLPADWGDGYPNVTVFSTIENQNRADYRLPILLDLPIRRKGIACEPLLEAIDLSKWLNSSVELVVVGGESGDNARACHFDWVLDIRQQCIQKSVSFQFRQTGARFVKDGRLYHVKRQFQHSQAAKAAIDYYTVR